MQRTEGQSDQSSHIHPRIGAAEGAAECADALSSLEEGWRAAAEEGSEEAAAQWEALALREAEAARTLAEAAARKAVRARTYDAR